MTKGVHAVATKINLVDGAVYAVGIENIMDADGNASTGASNINVKYSATSIAITDTIPAANSAATAATASYTLSGPASAGKITYTWTGGNWDYNSTQVYTMAGNDLMTGPHTINTNLLLVDGAVYTVSFEATDTAGNPATTVSNVVVTAQIPLTLIITSPIDGSYIRDGWVDIACIVNKLSAIKVNGTDYYGSISGDFNIFGFNLAEGKNTITVIATDDTGNTATATVKVTYDSIAPVVTITSPANGSYATKDTVTITGTIDDSAAIIKVQYYDYDLGQWIEKWTGTITGNTFEIKDVPLKEGWNSFYIKATDTAGNEVLTWCGVYFDTTPPAITITSPSATRYSTMNITGTVNEGSKITINGAVYGSPDGSCYSFSQNVTLTGLENIITITATDLAGNTTTEYVKVMYDTDSPVVTVTSPANWSALPSNIVTITGTIYDSSPTTVVMNYMNNGVWSPQLWQGTVSGNTFTISGVKVADGRNYLYITATDLAGNNKTVQLSLTYDITPPIVTSTTPGFNATEVSLESSIMITLSEWVSNNTITFTLSSDAGSVSGTTTYDVSALTLTFKPSTQLKRDTVYTAMIKGGSSGIKDAAGNTMATDYAWVFKTITLPVEVNITEPYDGATINKPTALIKGTVKSNTADVGVKVNLILAEINGQNWTATVPLQIGANTVEAIVTDISENTETQTITINTTSTQRAVTITTNPSSGIAPINTIFTIDTSISNPIMSYKIDFEGDGVTDLDTANVSNIAHLYDTPGIYYPTVMVTDSQNNTYTETTAINVLSKEEMDALLKGKWEGMKEALGSGDIATTLNYFAASSKGKYSEVFKTLKDYLPSIAANMRDINLVSVTGDVAEYRINRTEDVDGQSMEITYFIYFTKDGDGLWKIESF